MIPFMTIMAQANNCDMVYIFEESDNLIEIPKTPITIDYQLLKSVSRKSLFGGGYRGLQGSKTT